MSSAMSCSRTRLKMGKRWASSSSMAAACVKEKSFKKISVYTILAKNLLKKGSLIKI